MYRAASFMPYAGVPELSESSDEGASDESSPSKFWLQSAINS